ncbi:unnamed protein product [Vitrella brassicaformis CCMP3155]|uniref:SSD domain-containing protein n=1 Tax=Vitrella brassicaformis (strain CCMP3155) TaxID=1169540 RepID=A0A0G4EWQ5_VITBC|nr:unnamed protein product [Vitrella brassicaformis CCMP3155]|eukprot:CEM02499.1 unnamed protein product [Vitrella brassicaformis CCMP3155]
MGCLEIFHSFDHWLSRQFYKLSYAAGRHKVLFILIPVALAVAGLVGFMMLRKYEKEMLALYFPQESRGALEKEEVETIWGDQDYSYSTLLLLAKEGSFDANVLTAERFAKAATILQNVTSISVEHEGKTLTFSDVCDRGRSPDGSCFLLSVFNWWNNKTLPSTDEQLIEQLNAPTRVDQWGTPLRDEVPLLLAKAHYDAEGRVESAAAYHFVFASRQTDEGAAWETNLVSQILDVNTQEWGEREGFRVYVRTEHSIDTEIERSVGGNLSLMVIVFVVLIGYAVSVTYRHGNLVRSQMVLALTGVAIVGLSLCFAYGICALAGIPFTAVVGLSPFLILGIGVDDIFIVMNSFHEQDPDHEPRERVSLAMKECGPSITMTTLTSFVAFAAGAGSSFPVVKGFCLYTAIAILSVFLFTITTFLAFLHLDAIRQRRNRLDLICCKSRNEEAYRGSHKRLAFGLTAIFKKHLGPLLSKQVVKAAIIPAFLLLLYGGISGILRLEQGLHIRDLAPYGSFIRAYYAAEDRLELEEPVQSLDLTVSITGLNFTSAEDLTLLEQLTRDLEDSEYAHPETRLRITSFVRAYDQWRQMNQLNNGSDAEFYDHLSGFLNLKGRVYGDHVLRSASGTIRHCRIFVTTKGVPFREQAQLMLSFRNVVDSSELSRRPDVRLIVSHPRFFVFEQSLYILGETLLSMLLAALSVLVVTLFFLCSPRTVIFVFLQIVIIDINLIGYMAHWGVPLDSRSMIMLLLSIGFSVDYSAHLAHAFMLAPGTRDERMQQALSTMGTSIANGGMSTLLATLPLAASPSSIFEVFFKMMFMSVLFGMLHGLIFLPVLLSIMGPPAISRADEKLPSLPVAKTSSSLSRDALRPERHKPAYRNGPDKMRLHHQQPSAHRGQKMQRSATVGGHGQRGHGGHRVSEDPPILQQAAEEESEETNGSSIEVTDGSPIEVTNGSSIYVSIDK